MSFLGNRQLSFSRSSEAKCLHLYEKSWSPEYTHTLTSRRSAVICFGIWDLKMEKGTDRVIIVDGEAPESSSDEGR